MKIFHLYDEHFRVSIGKGSVSSMVYYLARATAERGHDVTVLERQWQGLEPTDVTEGVKFKRFPLSIGSDVQGEEIPYHEIRKPTGLLKLFFDRAHFAVKLGRYLRDVDFDVLHVHLPFTANFLVHIDSSLRSRMVYTAHVGEERKRFNLGDGSETPLPLKFFSPDIHLMKRVETSVVLNDRLKTQLQSKGLDGLEVVPNGVDLSEFPVGNGEVEEVSETYNLGPVTVMFAGTITPQKGIEILIEAADSVREQTQRDVGFILVGNDTLDREYAESMKATVRKKDLDNVVTFTGYIDYEELKALYSACDLFVLPSYEEGMPMVLLEALASGKPLVGSNVGGIPMQIRDGENGYLVEPGDARDLAAAIVELVDHPERRQAMGRRSRNLAEAKFGWDQIAEQYLEIYREVAP